MDSMQATSEILKIFAYSFGAAGIVYAAGLNWYKKKDSDNRTYAERRDAEVRANKEIMVEVVKVISDDKYIEYMKRRQALSEELISKDQKLLKDYRRLERLVDAILGTNVVEIWNKKR